VPNNQRTFFERGILHGLGESVLSIVIEVIASNIPILIIYSGRSSHSPSWRVCHSQAYGAVTDMTNSVTLALGYTHVSARIQDVSNGVT
jgi:hypothetical protein